MIKLLKIYDKRISETENKAKTRTSYNNLLNEIQHKLYIYKVKQQEYLRMYSELII